MVKVTYNKRYTQKEDKWLRNNYKKYTYEELTKNFNEEFNCNRALTAISKRCSGVLKLKDKPNVRNDKKRNNWTSEAEIEYLRKNISEYTYKQLVEKLKEEFGRVIKLHALEELCRRHNIKRDIPNNPIGTEVRKHHKVYVKVSDSKRRKNENNFNDNGNYMKKNRYLYRKHIGELSEDEVVIFLNGDNQDFRLENLHKVSKGTHGTMLLKGWRSENPDLTLAGVKWNELKNALKEDKQ